MLTHFWKVLFRITLASAILMVGIAWAPQDSYSAGSLVRLSGSNRINTAIAISQQLIPTPDTAGAVIIARSDDFPDALTASSLGGLLTAPILLNKPNSSLDPSVKTEIDRVLAAGKTVFIAGGTAALSSSIDSALKSTYKVERLAGNNRYDTARKIKARGDTARGFALSSLIVSRGDSYPDALSVSSYAANSGTPIVLVKPNSIPSETASVLTSFIDSAFILGGTAAISSSVLSSIENSIGNLATRISGSDRYATSTAIANFFFPVPEALAIATGTNFPDALAGGVLAGKTSLAAFGLPLLLTQPSSVPAVLSTYLKSHASTIDDLTSGYLFGGTSAISIDTEFAIENRI